MQGMLDRGIATRRGIMCSHREEPYKNAKRAGSLAHSEAAQDRCIILPLYVQMTQSDVERVAEGLRIECAPKRAAVANG
jgi:perosamine synthetase